MLQVNSSRIYSDLALTPHSYGHASSRCQRSAVFAFSNYTSRRVCQTHSQAETRRQREEANPEGCACRQGRAVQGSTGCQVRARSSSSCEGTCFSILLHSGPQKYQSYSSSPRTVKGKKPKSKSGGSVHSDPMDVDETWSWIKESSSAASQNGSARDRH